jgi:hypothetical protein
MEFILLGAGLLIPLLQEFLNKYIPSKLRQLTVWGISFLVGTVYVLFQDLDQFSWQYLLGHGAAIAVVAQGVYQYIIKPKR